MKYKHLTEERKKFIDELVSSLRAKYSTDSGIDFQSLARDYGAKFVVTNKVLEHSYLIRGGSKYVVVTKHLMKSVGEHGKGHEFGHCILGHDPIHPFFSEDEAENEANYFAEKLTGISTTKYRALIFPAAVLLLLMNPPAFYKKLYFPPSPKELVDKIESGVLK